MVYFLFLVQTLTMRDFGNDKHLPASLFEVPFSSSIGSEDGGGLSCLISTSLLPRKGSVFLLILLLFSEASKLGCNRMSTSEVKLGDKFLISTSPLFELLLERSEDIRDEGRGCGRLLMGWGGRVRISISPLLKKNNQLFKIGLSGFCYYTILLALIKCLLQQAIFKLLINLLKTFTMHDRKVHRLKVTCLKYEKNFKHANTIENYKSSLTLSPSYLDP